MGGYSRLAIIAGVVTLASLFTLMSTRTLVRWDEHDEFNFRKDADFEAKIPANSDGSGDQASIVARGKLIEKETEAGLKYLLYLPVERDGKSPMIVFLHGRGESGGFEITKKQSLPLQLDTNSTLKQEFPFITIMPQCPRRCAHANEWLETTLRETTRLTNEIAAKYDGDFHRISLLGQSMGGNGAWEYAAMQKNMFSAVVPICGYTRTFLYDRDQLASHLYNTSVWAFHADNDVVIPVDATDGIIHVLKQDKTRDKDTKYTRYKYAPGPPMPEFERLVGHGSYEYAFRDPDLFKWLQAQRCNKCTGPGSQSWNNTIRTGGERHGHSDW